MVAQAAPAEVATVVDAAPVLDTAPASTAGTEPPQHGGSANIEEPAAASPAETQSATEPQSGFEGLEALRRTTLLSPAKRAKAEDRLEEIRHLRQTGRKRGADNAWRKFRRDFPEYPVAADDFARPVTD
jgi:hypothetical protein